MKQSTAAHGIGRRRGIGLFGKLSLMFLLLAVTAGFLLWEFRRGMLGYSPLWQYGECKDRGIPRLNLEPPQPQGDELRAIEEHYTAAMETLPDVPEKKYRLLLEWLKAEGFIGCSGATRQMKQYIASLSEGKEREHNDLTPQALAILQNHEEQLKAAIERLPETSVVLAKTWTPETVVLYSPVDLKSMRIFDMLLCASAYRAYLSGDYAESVRRVMLGLVVAGIIGAGDEGIASQNAFMIGLALRTRCAQIGHRLVLDERVPVNLKARLGKVMLSVLEKQSTIPHILDGEGRRFKQMLRHLRRHCLVFMLVNDMRFGRPEKHWDRIIAAIRPVFQNVTPKTEQELTQTVVNTIRSGTTHPFAGIWIASIDRMYRIELAAAAHARMLVLASFLTSRKRLPKSLPDLDAEIPIDPYRCAPFEYDPGKRLLRSPGADGSDGTDDDIVVYF